MVKVESIWEYIGASTRLKASHKEGVLVITSSITPLEKSSSTSFLEQRNLLGQRNRLILPSFRLGVEVRLNLTNCSNGFPDQTNEEGKPLKRFSKTHLGTLPQAEKHGENETSALLDALM